MHRLFQRHSRRSADTITRLSSTTLIISRQIYILIYMLEQILKLKKNEKKAMLVNSNRLRCLSK